MQYISFLAFQRNISMIGLMKVKFHLNHKRKTIIICNLKRKERNYRQEANYLT